MIAADGAIGVATKLEGSEVKVLGRKRRELADRRRAEAEQKLDDLVRLQRPDDPRQYAHHAAFGAAGDASGVRRLGIHAAIARPALAGAQRVGQMRREDRNHAFEAEDAAVDIGFFEDHAGVVDAVARGKIIGAVDDDVVVPDQIEHIGGIHDRFVLDDLHVGIQIAQSFCGRLHFFFADVADAEENLPLKIRRRDDIDIRQPDRPHPRRREVQRDRAAEPARADAQDLGVEELRLPRLTHLGQEKVAAVADLLLGRELSLLGDRETLVLPAREAPPHRDDVRVAELLQDAPREQGPRSAAAVGHDRRVLCRHRLFDPHLEEAARQGNGAGHEALAEFLPLTYVEQHRPLAAVEASLHVVGRHFGHELPCLLHHLLVRLRHRSALGPVEEVHPILEPAPHGPRVTRIDEQAHDAQYAPHRILTREGERVLAEAEEVNELLTIDAPEQSAAPEREQDHVRTGFAGDGCTIPSSSSR